MIRIESVSHAIGGTAILRDISLTIPKGGISALVGPNGAGKSTLLSLIARLQPLQNGRIMIEDLEIGKCPSTVLARRLAILPQSDDIAPRLTVQELVGFGRYPYHKGRPGSKDVEKVEEALAAFDLCAFRHRQIDTLSGGQRQRALIAMTYAQDTDYLLLDEPLNNLDIAASRALMQQLRKMAQDDNRTIVIVLHDLNIATRYSDFLVAMVDGQIGASGTPRQVVTQQLVQTVFGTDAEVIRVNNDPIVRI